MDLTNKIVFICLGCSVFPMVFGVLIIQCEESRKKEQIVIQSGFFNQVTVHYQQNLVYEKHFIPIAAVEKCTGSLC